MTGIAVVRSGVQWLIGLAVTSTVGSGIVTFLSEQLGIELDTAWLVNTVSLFIFGIVVWLVNKFGKNFDWINRIISLGLSKTGPAYVPAGADAVLSTANPVGADTVRTVDTPPPGSNEAAARYDEGYNPGDPGYNPQTGTFDPSYRPLNPDDPNRPKV